MLKLLAFLPTMRSDLRPSVLAYKAARYLSTLKVNELKPTANEFLNSDVINGLKSELSEHLAAAEDVSDEVVLRR